MTKAKVGSVGPNGYLGAPLRGEVFMLGEEKTMKAAPAAPIPHGLAGMNDRIEITFANEPPVTGPRSAQDGATEGPNAKEQDWLPLVTADPAFWLKETDRR